MSHIRGGEHPSQSAVWEQLNMKPISVGREAGCQGSTAMQRDKNTLSLTKPPPPPPLPPAPPPFLHRTRGFRTTRLHISGALHFRAAGGVSSGVCPVSPTILHSGGRFTRFEKQRTKRCSCAERHQRHLRYSKRTPRFIVLGPRLVDS